ncbi:hypothetical protein ALP02_02448 [Pseudomonas coronafaciens pv. garcae]|nr:hypothetical protein ALP02_02448 [Pseudomonas coronafaciens pv. garcae]
MRDDAPAEDYDRAGRKIEDAQAMVAQRDLVPEGSAISRALDYSLKRWAALSRYLDDGAVPIENNWCENQIRPWALGRKNRLFAGRYAAENVRRLS